MKGSNRKKKASKEERAEPKFDSVFDFLYYDSRRVGSFLSQFDDFGLLQQLEKTETSKESASDKARLSVSIGPSALRLGGSLEKGTDETGADSAKLIYDPLWTNARTFLDFLQARELINRNIDQAHIGQFILIRGRITLIDLGLIKNMWNVSEARENAIATAIANRPNDPRATVEKDMSVFFQIAGQLPYEAQCLLACEDGQIAWSLLRPEFLTGSATDLGLRYGMGIDGEWVMLGIVDALPSSAAESAETNAAVVSAIPLHNGGPEVARIAGVLRRMGRPEIAFGITPLLIFRSVSG